MEGLLIGLLLPLTGTVLGAACVFLFRDRMPSLLEKTLHGFAAGVMVAASVWSLLIPAMDMCASQGMWRVVPATVGVAAGIALMLLIDSITPHQHMHSDAGEGPRTKLSRTTKLALAITIHNIPEGMAVGVSLAAAMEGNAGLSMAAAAALAVGMAVQNIPEGAIVSLPLRAASRSRGRSFAIGALSGVVEPIAAIITMLLAAVIVPALPYLLAFAAGAMLYVVVEELIPETQRGAHSDMGTIGFGIGFILMMILDVVLG
ncbi:MAG: ZIP family metal transporter [Muribaculaceae bacterium]|nr:ZIP family metal transporter [Muribaculaceae bacterium]